MYRKAVLSNGVRVVAERMPATKSVTIGIWVNVGSRDELPGEEGASHFLEHMFFKGTRRRSAAQISREIDALGGEINAFTTRETTTFYVKVLDQHLKPALTLLADLFHHSRFDPREVKKEKQVVLEEIRMVQDDPEELLHDLHMQHQLHEHPLGKPILGNPATVQHIQQKSLLDFIDKHYATSQTVVAVAGNFDWKSSVVLLEKYFGHFRRSKAVGAPQRWPARVNGGLLIREKELEQTHLCFGLQGFAIDHKDRYAAHALNTVLGGGVSSRLFQEVREKRGLAYSIYSFLSSFSDSGTLTIYAATRPREVSRLVELVCQELFRLRRNGLNRTVLQRAKDQMKGSLMLSLEGTHSRMNKLAKEELHLGRHFSMEEFLAEIDRVTQSQVGRLAHEIFDVRDLSITAVGPVSRRAIQAALH